MKDLNEELVKETLRRVQHQAGMPLWELNTPHDIQVRFRVDEKISPAMFKPDPLIPGGYLANSLTLRAMRPQLFIADQEMIELENIQHCACSNKFDTQFWRICPFCGRE